MIGFLDASALIYLVDGAASWALAAQATLRQLASEGPGLQLAVSRLSGLECRVGPLRRGDQASLDRFDACCLQLGPDCLVSGTRATAQGCGIPRVAKKLGFLLRTQNLCHLGKDYLHY